MMFEDDLRDLIESFETSPHPSFKVTSYFPAYVEMFRHLRNTRCTFVETGVLNGGSLFMWRKWLGPEARIIGCDLNPEAIKWQAEGFEIFIGDQGDPAFWQNCFQSFGDFDALLDDGGHQSFQQIVTLTESLKVAKPGAIVVIEDTCTSMMTGFAAHGDRTFLNYAKTSTDVLTARMSHLFPGHFPDVQNAAIMELMRSVGSIRFYPGIVAYGIDPRLAMTPELVWNRKPEKGALDYRFRGSASAEVEWPNPHAAEKVVVKGRSI